MRNKTVYSTHSDQWNVIQLTNRGHCCSGFNKGADIVTGQNVRNNTNDEMVQH